MCEGVVWYGPGVSLPLLRVAGEYLGIPEACQFSRTPGQPHPCRAVWPSVKMKIDHGGKAAWPQSQPGVAETPGFIIILSVTQLLY